MEEEVQEFKGEGFRSFLLYLLIQLLYDLCPNGSSVKTKVGDFPGGPVVKTLPSNAEGVGSIPGQGIKTLHASWSENQHIKQKQYCNRFSKGFKNSTHQKNLKKNKTFSPIPLP